MAETPNRSGLATVPDDVILQELGDEIVLANLESGDYFALNEVAARTWVLLRDASSLDDVVSALLDEYEIDKTTLATDVSNLVKQFEENGLLQINNG